MLSQASNALGRIRIWRDFVSAIKLLARNDNNKKLLVELGALELLVELAKGTIEEQIGM